MSQKHDNSFKSWRSSTVYKLVKINCMDTKFFLLMTPGQACHQHPTARNIRSMVLFHCLPHNVASTHMDTLFATVWIISVAKVSEVACILLITNLGACRAYDTIASLQQSQRHPLLLENGRWLPQSCYRFVCGMTVCCVLFVRL
jgi:hypothetical protein